MRVYSDPKENAFLAYDHLLNFKSRVGWMDSKEREYLREYIERSGFEKSVKERLFDLIEFLHDEDI